MSNESGLLPGFIISKVLIYLDFQFSHVKFLYICTHPEKFYLFKVSLMSAFQGLSDFMNFRIFPGEMP